MNVNAIKCTRCAAPLKVNGGGHRIRTLNCHYCGTIMDVQHDHRQLGKFVNQSKPDSPLQIGMEGKIKNIPFIIIGMVGYRSNYGDTWVDLFLFSNTHGYAYLTYTMGHFVFTRRIRYLPDKNMRQLSPHATFRADNKHYTLFESYRSTVTYVAGELTWIAKQKDSCQVTDAIAPPFMFTQETRTRAKETEYYFSEYIEPNEIKKHFTLNYETKRDQHFIHPAQPFHAPITKALSKASQIALAVALLLVIVITLFGNGKTIYDSTLEASEIQQGTLTRNFTINNPNHLIELRYRASLNNAWTNYDITLFKDDFEVFSFNKQLAYYSGYDSDGSWSEGEKNGMARFKVKEAGNYALRIHASNGGTGETGTKIQHNSLTITIKEGVMGTRYATLLFFIGLLFYLWFYWTRYRFDSKRWQDIDND